jgi:hypothetical protein
MTFGRRLLLRSVCVCSAFSDSLYAARCADAQEFKSNIEAAVTRACAAAFKRWHRREYVSSDDSKQMAALKEVLGRHYPWLIG